MSNEAMVFVAMLVFMVLVFAVAMWSIWLSYLEHGQDQRIHEAELYTKHKP